MQRNNKDDATQATVILQWSTVEAYCSALGTGWEVGDSYGLEMEGLENEVLYPLKWHCFDAEKNK